MIKPRVLFMCSGNSARSQMAEAFLRAYAGDHLDVYSAGLDPQEIHPLTIRAMAGRGFDLAGHRAKGLEEFLGKVHFGYLVTVCSRAHETCPTFPGMGTRIFWPFEDPTQAKGTEEEQLKAFRRVRDTIDDLRKRRDDLDMTAVMPVFRPPPHRGRLQEGARVEALE